MSDAFHDASGEEIKFIEHPGISTFGVHPSPESMELIGKIQSKTKLTSVEQHKILCEVLNELYEEKNRLYGDNFHKTYKEYGSAVLCLRLDDKLGRLKSILLNNKSATNTNESVEDTLKDLANYAIMSLMEIINEKENKTI